MNAPFVITTATNHVRLDANRHGEVAYTVSNTGDRPVRARARIVPQPPAQADWFTIAGGAERDFAAAGTDQFKVQMILPPTAGAGSYLARLDVFGVDNPEEEYTEGPTVAFDAVVPERVKKLFSWWVPLAGLAALVLLAGLLIVLFRGGDGATGGGGDGAPITDLAGIFDAMQLEDLQTDKRVYASGETVTFTYNLVNRSASRLVVPDDNQFGRPLVGVRQHFIERLGTIRDIPAIPPNIARDGNRFAAGGAIIPVSGEVAPGQAFSLDGRLETAGFPASQYRISVEYRTLDGQVIQTQTVDFQIR
ncbi:MAG TPA: hypothetical protein VER55_15145 [Ardenticatenaceae bacterium]|nr:hypothetical protein [Ardenticatenaceae bacterium]